VNFISGDKNSASKILALFGSTNIAFPKKGVPGPIIISLNNQPTNILPNPSINSGTAIFGASSNCPENSPNLLVLCSPLASLEAEV
jgi:hypothetical protein